VNPAPDTGRPPNRTSGHGYAIAPIQNMAPDFAAVLG